MALLHRVLLSYAFTFVFMVVLSVRLDQQLDWNWFLIFIPLWVFDFVALTLLTIRLVSHCRVGYDQSDMSLSMVDKVWLMCMVVLKLSFQILLCVRFQYAENLAFYWVFIPLWMILASSAVRMFPWSSRLR